MELPEILMACILYLQKRFNLTIFGFVFLYFSQASSQPIVKEFQNDSLNYYLDDSCHTINKIIPDQFNSVIRIALAYYPELKNSKIVFKVKKQSAPLAARPRFFSIFRKASKRKYLVTICNRLDSKLSPIMLENLSTNAQIGVLGHELSHIADYNSRYGIYFMKLFFMHLNKKSIDRFEYTTDKWCIAHGLGYQLLSWSKEVRTKLNLLKWKGAKDMKDKGRERYMNPDTIIETMRIYSIYD